MYRTAVRIIGNEHDAEEVVQNSFLRAFESLHRFDEKSSFTTWCFRITTNQCLDHIRKSERRRQYFESSTENIDQMLAENSDLSEQALLRKDLLPIVEYALGNLSPKIRTVVILKDQEELSYGEISSILNCPYGTIASRLARGRSEIAAQLTSYGITASYFQNL